MGMPTEPIAFFVPGVPQPKGSAKWVRSKSTGRPIAKTNEALQSWAGAIAGAAQSAMARRDEGPALLTIPLHAELTFNFNRPKSVSAKKRPRHSVTPDIDKLVRAALDGMTGVVYRDDAQIDCVKARKVYTEEQAGLAVVLAERLEQ